MQRYGDTSLINNNIATETVSEAKHLRPSVPDQKRELRLRILAACAFAVDSACGAWLVARGGLADLRSAGCANETFPTGRRIPRDT